MLNLLSKFFSPLGALEKITQTINALELDTQSLTDDQLRERAQKLREEMSGGRSLDDALPAAFALARESARRTLNQRHFDVQLMGGVVLHQGKIAEMMTGEGKTLTATAPIFLNALEGKGVHVVTVNEYLAKRDAVWMGQVYHALGLTVACLIHDGARRYDPDFLPSEEEKKLDAQRDATGSFLVQEKFLRPISRREAYQADILYGTNHEFGFDYLRDNLAHRVEDQVQRSHHYAVIDEVDSILIDEARTPLIISAPDQESSQYYKTFSRLVRRLEKETDYTVDEKMKSADITDAGIEKIEKELRINNIYAPENMRLTHYLHECLRAEALFQRDRDYVVKDGEIVIVDQFTGRMMIGRRYSGGLHQAIEAKEGVVVQNESRTFAQITIQNYFRLYKKLAGMTGTAQTSAEEFDKVYHLGVVSIPAHRLLIRKDLADQIYKDVNAKYTAVVGEIKRRHELGQPLLVGTVSIEKNEELSRRLSQSGVPHEVLNAKNNEREAAIIAQAGTMGSVTVATNMAGRGVDIILGGNPPDPAAAEKVRALGGLHVVGTERHEARRIDNQLRGRAGRQGDPGSGQFFLSLEDDLMRVFGGERIKNLMTTLMVPDDQPIESGMVSRAVLQAQSKIEGINFDARKHLLEYDDVLNKQRLAIYAKRQDLLQGVGHPQSSDRHSERSEESQLHTTIPLSQTLSALDFFWMNHLEEMDHLSESVRLRAYGQHDPLVEYRREGHKLYQNMLAAFDQWVEEQQAKQVSRHSERSEESQPSSLRAERSNLPVENSKSQIPNFKQIPNPNLQIQNTTKEAYPGTGRNEPCPCGAKKSDGTPMKYKHCHGK